MIYPCQTILLHIQMPISRFLILDETLHTCQNHIVKHYHHWQSVHLKNDIHLECIVISYITQEKIDGMELVHFQTVRQPYLAETQGLRSLFSTTQTHSHSRHVDTGWMQAAAQHCLFYWHPHKTSPGNTRSRKRRRGVRRGERERGEEWQPGAVCELPRGPSETPCSCGGPIVDQTSPEDSVPMLVFKQCRRLWYQQPDIINREYPAPLVNMQDNEFQ